MSVTLPRIFRGGTSRPALAGCVQHRWIAICLSLTIAGGCATNPAPTATILIEPDPASSLESTGAADLFARLDDPSEAVRRASADAIIERELLGDLNAREQFEVYATALEFAIAANDTARVEAFLESINASGDIQTSRLYGLKADHFARIGDDLNAFLHLVHARFLDAEERNRRIWQHLLAIPDRLISTPDSGSELFDRSARAWWDLAERFTRATSPAEQQRIWSSWRELNASNQAITGAFGAFDASLKDLRIALLLPLDGEMASAGEAVRNGFVAAGLHGVADNDEILFFDTSRGIDQAIDDALAEEVDLIVGPLLKDNVNIIAERRIDVPIVALNQIDEASDNLIQLALASEDDARSIAKAVRQQGFERLLLIAIPQAWSQRGFVALTRELGNAVVETVTLDSSRNVTEVTAGLFDVDEGHARHAVVRRLVGDDVEYSARRRQDIDAVIALVGSVQLAGLIPALSFHEATDLPILLPSNILRSTPDSGAVESMQVAVPTWQLTPNRLERESITRIAPTIQSPLVALGIDAYRIAKRLDAFRNNEPIIGSTGVLRYVDGMVRRDLHWAEYERGRLRHRPLMSAADISR